MKIVVNDHSGHAFPLQLSKQFAQSGYEVLHAFSTSFQSPKGNFDDLHATGGKLTVVPISVKGRFQKYSLLKRRKQEIEYAQQLIRKLDIFRPTVVLSGTTPLFVQQYVQRYCIQQGIKFVFWCQDIYTVAIRQIARQRLGFLGFPLWNYFNRLEKELLQKSAHIISITPAFNDLFRNWKISPDNVTYIPNWAPIQEITLTEKNNSWARRHRLADKICILYSGTLGLKHNPAMLSAAAAYFSKHPDLVFVVISEGLGATFLEKEKARLQLDNLLLLPFQDFKDMSDVLGTADILLGILENDAGTYSVPSKVLTYLCARKPVVLSIPLNNLSAAIVQDNKAGYCVSPEDQQGFYDHIEKLVNDAKLRQELGNNGRAYAETNFDIQEIENRFLDVFNTILHKPVAESAAAY
ncbi:Glycosyl transferase 4-like domain-containing protein [Chitinophaga arvensicola]|uniref:Glycosyl transferase 4-like domain-containing protein n=2 Tax=Chitinophaga arvensicola TaxID=29529 RepID=A0A1I0S4N5_9BACT|nr:Glycosyl transferase 4-like domain-containing protein [Chitinophaga arvensicola]